MASDDTTAGLMKRLVESVPVDWTKVRSILDVSTREEAIALLAQALAKARDELAKAKSAMALLVQSQSDHAVLTLDVWGNVVSVSPNAERLLGWPVKSMLGQPIDALLTNRMKAIEASSEEMAQADRGEAVLTEREHTRQDGTTFNARHCLYALIGSGGHVSGFVRRIEDVTEREAYELQIEELDATIALLLG